jgi:hypothetical protein
VQPNLHLVQGLSIHGSLPPLIQGTHDVVHGHIKEHFKCLNCLEPVGKTVPSVPNSSNVCCFYIDLNSALVMSHTLFGYFPTLLEINKEAKKAVKQNS